MNWHFRRNVGNLDRTIRVVIGAALVLTALFQTFNFSLLWQWIIGIAGVASVLEGILGY